MKSEYSAEFTCNVVIVEIESLEWNMVLKMHEMYHYITTTLYNNASVFAII